MNVFTYDAICAITRGRNLKWRFTNDNGDFDFDTVNREQLDGYLVLGEQGSVLSLDNVEVYRISFRDNWFYYSRLI